MDRTGLFVSAALGIAVLVAAPAVAQKIYDPGASDTEIKIGQTKPYSGPASAYATVGRAEAAYFRMVNEQGGVNGRKIQLTSYDDGYNPAKTVEQVRKLVESDGVLLIFEITGTPTNAAVQKYLNDKHIPQLFMGSGASRFIDPQNFPWSIAGLLSYRAEGRIYGRFFLDNYPNAKIGALYQNDDFGRDYLAGLKEGLGDKAATMIVATAPYETSDPTVDSQIAKLQSAGADLLYDIAVAKFASQAIRKVAALGWKPIHILNGANISIGSVLAPAGLENAKGIISVNYGKDPGDRTWDDDPGMRKWRAFMDKYYPDGDKRNVANSFGYSAAQLLVEVLTRCGANLTRENVMRQVTSLRDVVLDLSLPGVSINTSPTDYRIWKQLRMMRFDGEHWERFGPVITDEPRS
jgi:branched-chain amino acid transport system substrate-binding protein